MGNSQNKEGINLANEIDYLAANYILYNKEDVDLTKDIICQTLVKKVAALLKKNLNGLQSNFLLKARVLQPAPVPAETAAAPAPVPVEDDESKCEAISTIAKFYVQIGSLFAAIMTSVYKPKMGFIEPMAQTTAVQAPPMQSQAPVVQAPVAEKTSGGAAYLGEPYNFCSERLKSLMNGQDLTKITDPKTPFIINPTVCAVKKEINNLEYEPGMTELHTLYYDIYDLKEGTFTGMSKEMQEIYRGDVKLFYKSFYGEDVSLPSNIVDFSNISLNDYAKDNSGCIINGIYNTPYKGSLSDRLFKAYAEHIKAMEERMTTNQNQLLKILDELFIVKKDVKEEKKEDKSIITLHPDLNDRKLQRLTKSAREMIVQMYLMCENDYKDGIKIYQQIVDTKLQNFIPAKKRGLNDKINELMTSSFIKGGGGDGTDADADDENKSILPTSFFEKKTRKVAYDFDGVIHTYVGLPDKYGQRGAMTSDIQHLLKFPFRKIIEQIYAYAKKGYEQYIISARIEMAFIIAFLRKLRVTPAMIPDENVLSAFSDVKWEMLAQKEINEFYDDSCIVITSIQEHRLNPELKYLDNLFLVFPENLNWIEIEKNQDLDLKTCLRLKS